MQVVATARGYFGRVRQAGETFEVPDDTKKASWFKPVAAAEPDAGAREGKRAGPANEPAAEPDVI